MGGYAPSTGERSIQGPRKVDLRWATLGNSTSKIDRHEPTQPRAPSQHIRGFQMLSSFNQRPTLRPLKAVAPVRIRSALHIGTPSGFPGETCAACSRSCDGSGAQRVYVRGAVRAEPLGRTAWSHPGPGPRPRRSASRSRPRGSALRAVVDRAARTTNRRQVGKAPALEGLFGILLGPALAASVRAEVVSDLRRATSVQHHRRTEPSATNAANARSPQNQRNLAVTSTANDGWKTFTRQGSLVRSQYRPPRTTTCGASDPQGPLFAARTESTEPRVDGLRTPEDGAAARRRDCSTRCAPDRLVPAWVRLVERRDGDTVQRPPAARLALGERCHEKAAT